MSSSLLKLKVGTLASVLNSQRDSPPLWKASRGCFLSENFGSRRSWWSRRQYALAGYFCSKVPHRLKGQYKFLKGSTEGSTLRLHGPGNGISRSIRRNAGSVRPRLQVSAKVQAMDYTTIKAACTELASKWAPAKIEKIVQTDRFTLSMSLRTIEKSGWLTLCWNPACAHISVCREPPAGDAAVADSFSFGDQLRYLLKGLAILEVRLPQEWERVVEVRLGGRPSDPPSKHIFVEIMGRYSNVFLTNIDMGVLACAYQVGAKMTSVRMVQVGGMYRPPPAAQGSAPQAYTGLAEWKAIVGATLDGNLLSSLVQAFRGVGPGLALELMSRSGLSKESIVAEMTEDDWNVLHKVWLDWLTTLNKATFAPGLVRSAGLYSVLGGDSLYISSSDRKRASHVGTESVLAMLDDYYTAVHETEKFQQCGCGGVSQKVQLRQQLVAKVSAASKRAQSKVKLYSDQVKASTGYAEISKMADLLMANLHVCKPGASSIELPDFETGEATTIALDPRQTALTAAQKLYKRSQKLRRSANAVAPLLVEAETELSYLTQVEVSLQQLELYTSTLDLRSLEEVRDELIDGKYLKPLATGAPPPSSKQKKKQLGLENLTGNMRRFTSPSGFQVLVGRNNRQNDVLTHRVATDYDLWFHARNTPGSHLLLRVPPGKTPTKDDLQLAADLAAYFSKNRGSGKVDVSYTSPKYLQKVKGGKLGMVKVEKETVMLGRASDPPPMAST